MLPSARERHRAAPENGRDERKGVHAMSATAGTQSRVSRAMSHAPRAGQPPIGPLARLAVAAPIAFFAIMLVLGAATPGYDAIRQMGSELSLGLFGPIMIANFLALGLTELAFGVALWRAAGPAASGRLGAAMVALAGVAFLDAGVFLTDPMGAPVTTHGVLHVLAAVAIFFLAVPIGGLATAWRFRRRRGFAAYSALTAIATPLLLVATFTSGDILGLMERVVIAVTLAWLTNLAWRVLRGRLLGAPPQR
jgi:hypothetical membrane protein